MAYVVSGKVPFTVLLIFEVCYMRLFFNRMTRLLWYLLAMIIRRFSRINPNQIICWEFHFKQCGGNPKYMTDYILKQEKNYKVYWAFAKGIDTSTFNKEYIIVRYPSVKYLIALYTSKYVINNYRNDKMETFFVKKKNQKYIMSWHGSTPLKKVEKDVQDSLGIKYVSRAKADSRACDLMLSNCSFFTKLIRDSFWYDGEILEQGIPCNDIYYNIEDRILANKRIRSFFHIPEGDFMVMYAPTFRNKDNTIKPYIIDWGKLIPVIEKKSNRNVIVLVRLHPNLLGMVDTASLVDYPKTIDVTSYPDMQQLLCAMDMLITDYSSIMFDATLMDKPCLLYAKDSAEYDRGFYFPLDSLPFSLSTTQNDLIEKIEHFDYKLYYKRIVLFKKNVLGIKEDGDAAKAFFEWMEAHR